MGCGWGLIYNIGVREMLKFVYELPYAPIISFIYLYIIILCIRSMFSKNKQTYELTDPEPYGKLMTSALTLYMYILILGIINLF